MIDSSFEAFVRGHVASLDRHAFALTGERHAAEDLVQETLIKVAGAWRRIREDGNPAGYASAVMFRTYVSSWRARRRRPSTVELTTDPQSRGDDYATVDTRLLLQRSLRALPRLQRAVLVATYLEDLTDDEISALISRAPATVRSLRRRGLQSLSAVLGPGGQNESLPAKNASRLASGTSRSIDTAFSAAKEVNHGPSGISAS